MNHPVELTDSERRRPPRTRGRGLRTTTGCTTCRKRHLKCDETKPICQQCTRNRKSCIYPKAVGNSMQHSEPPSPQHTDASHEVSHQSTSGHVDDIVERRTEVQQPDALSSRQRDLSPQHVYDTTRLRSTALGNEAPNALSSFNYTSPASTGTASGDQPIEVATARWFGMLVGDADIELETSVGSVTTSQNFGTISGTDDLSLNESYLLRAESASRTDAVYAYPRAFVAGSSTSQQVFSQCDFPWQAPTLLSLKQDEQSMFDIFVTHISQWIDLFDPDRHFASLVPRLALHNVGLMNAILALSIRHNSLGCGGVNNPSFGREDALQYYHETLQYIRRAMQYETYHTSLELLATTLIVSAYEMLDGSSRDWERHLQGVFWIQRSQVIHGDSGGLRGSVWWAWLCQDIWAAFRDKRRVFTFWKPEKLLSDLSPVQLAARSIYILGRVINFCVQEESSNLPENIMSRLRTAETLTAMLDQWQSLLTPEFRPLPHSQQLLASIFPSIWIYPPVFAVSMQVYHAARILVLLHRPSLGGISEVMKRQASLNRHVDAICGIASTTFDYASSTMSSQCLFVGLCAQDQQRKEGVLQLIAQCRARTGWPVIRLEDTLRECWQNAIGN